MVAQDRFDGSSRVGLSDNPAFFSLFFLFASVGAVTGCAWGFTELCVAGTLDAGFPHSAFRDFRSCLTASLAAGAACGVIVALGRALLRLLGMRGRALSGLEGLISVLAATPGTLKPYFAIQTAGLIAACGFLLVTRNKQATLAFIPAVLVLCALFALFRRLARRASDPRGLAFRSVLALSLWIPLYIAVIILILGRSYAFGFSILADGDSVAWIIGWVLATGATILFVLCYQAVRIGRGGFISGAVAPAVTVVAALFLPAGPLIAPSGFEAKNPKNIILIGIDTLRRDFTTLPGDATAGSANLTPNLEELATRGVIFNGAVTQTPWTIPSFASVFTGLYPHEHGAMTIYSRLAGNQVTLAEILREAGYRTGSVVSHSFVSSRRGFDQGFDFVSEENIKGVRAITADGVTDGALRFLAETDEDPFFLFVHYFDCHATYMDHADSELSDGYGGWLREESREMEVIRYLRHLLDPADLEFLRNLYGEEVRFIDAQIGRIIASLEEKGLLRDTAIVVLSDHGEEFMERGYMGHTMSLYDELIRVPLFFVLPGVEGGGRIVDAAVETRAVFSTLLDFAGVGWRDEGMPRSLLPLITGKRDAHSGEGAPLDAFAVAGCKPLPGGQGTGITGASIRSGRWKLIYYKNRDKKYLYDVASDPDETVEQSRNHPAEMESLMKRLEAWIGEVESHAGGGGASADISARDEQNMRNLGYM